MLFLWTPYKKSLPLINMLCFSKIWLDFDIEKEAVVLIGNDALNLFIL